MLRRDIMQALISLSEEHCAVILLVGVEGLSYESVGQVLGIPLGTVMSRLSRAREQLRHRPMRVLARDAAAAYETFVIDPQHPVEVRANGGTDLERWQSSRLDRPLNIPDLTALGFRLMGGRVLPARNGPAAQLMYDDDHGTRLTLYVQPMEVAGTEFRDIESHDVRTIYWARRHMVFAVTARTGQERLRSIAADVCDQLAKSQSQLAPKQNT